MTAQLSSSFPIIGSDSWRSLRLLNLYRLILAGLFVTLLSLRVAPQLLGQHDPGLFNWVSGLYLAAAIGFSFLIQIHWPRFSSQVFWQFMADVVAITLIMHASGGAASGLGMLLVVAVAGASLLTGGRVAILFAALASLAILAQEVYSSVYLLQQSSHYTQSGILGAACFATAILAHELAKRARESADLARQREIDLASLEQLNEHIIQRMQSGIVAVDGQGTIRLANRSARKLLGRDANISGRALSAVAPELQDCWLDWRDRTGNRTRFMQTEGVGANVIASFADLEQPGRSGALIFLEDSAGVSQRAQQLKLASLGRLTASIAHEVRNPLGAISHAGQLLSESPDLPESDRRLTHIIAKQSARVNGIIENVMQLSRREPTQSSQVDLKAWLEEYRSELLTGQQLDAAEVEMVLNGEQTKVYMDPSQMRQVFDNLCTNGLRYARHQPRLRIVVGRLENEDRIHVDVLDSGSGIEEKDEEHLFEPFFTTETEGSGLGLYIARELCEVNKATLKYLGQTELGHGFRISFSHPRRQEFELQ